MKQSIIIDTMMIFQFNTFFIILNGQSHIQFSTFTILIEISIFLEEKKIKKI